MSLTKCLPAPSGNQYQERSAPVIEIVLGDRERLVDAQPGTPGTMWYGDAWPD